MGFAVEFVEMQPQILSTVANDTCVVQKTCDAWTSYANVYNPVQEDSGV